MQQIKVIDSSDENKKILKTSEENFSYQELLTSKLDEISGDFNQNILNEIVLWKVNRYVRFKDETLRLINRVPDKSVVLDEKLTHNILASLLCEKGVRLPMASTILRFKNPNIYQIIDQRVYRIITGEHYNSYFNANSELSVSNQIKLYINYLKELRLKCEELEIPFYKSDRILYEADKVINREVKIKY